MNFCSVVMVVQLQQLLASAFAVKPRQGFIPSAACHAWQRLPWPAADRPALMNSHGLALMQIREQIPCSCKIWRMFSGLLVTMSMAEEDGLGPNGWVAVIEL
jgi:hypothetical protein